MVEFLALVLFFCIQTFCIHHERYQFWKCALFTIVIKVKLGLIMESQTYDLLLIRWNLALSLPSRFLNHDPVLWVYKLEIHILCYTFIIGVWENIYTSATASICLSNQVKQKTLMDLLSGQFCPNDGLVYMNQCMRLWYLSHRRPAKVKASLRIRAVLPKPSLLAHMKYGSRRNVQPKIRSWPTGWLHMRAEEWVYGGWKVP